MCSDIKTVSPLFNVIMGTMSPHISVSLIFVTYPLAAKIILDREFTLSWSYSSLNITNRSMSLCKAPFHNLFSLHPCNFRKARDNVKPILCQSLKPLGVRYNRLIRRVWQIVTMGRSCTRQCKTGRQITSEEGRL